VPVTGNGTIFPIPYNTTLYNVNGGFNTATGLYVAQETGVHRFGVAVDLTSIAGTHTQFVVRLVVVGASAGTYFLAEGSPGAYRDSSGRVIINASAQIEITAADTVGVRIEVSGGALAVAVNGGSATQSGYFTGAFLTSSSFTGILWSAIAANQALLPNRGYICTGGALLLSLPAVSSFAQIIEISLSGGTSFSITQGAGQQIGIGNLTTTAGVGGSLTSTSTGDSLRMICTVASTTWRVLSQQGVFIRV
jgi:hypothetical protein